MAFCGPHGEPITINGNAPDVSGRPETSAITKVEFTPKSLYIRHTAEAWWPEPIPPEWTGGVQYTSWFVVNVGGTWYTTGCLEYWKTPPDDPYSGSWKGGPDPAPFSDGARNWWYHASPQNTRQPGVGETVGMFVTAGSQRMKDVVDPNCVERSNIVWLAVPPNDTGLFTFEDQGGGVAPGPPSGAIPYNEAYSVEFGHACNAVYQESGAAMDPGMISVQSQRCAYDYYVGGMSWDASCAKHTNELRAVYGLPPL
jgi:hypothetical protein